MDANKFLLFAHSPWGIPIFGDGARSIRERGGRREVEREGEREGEREREREKEGEREEVLSMLFHNRKVWVGTSMGE